MFYDVLKELGDSYNLDKMYNSENYKEVIDLVTSKTKELAKKLDKTQYPFTLSLEEVKYCKENDIVVVFGNSDDLMEFDGAIYEELGCYISGARGYKTCYLDKDGNR